MPKSISPPTAYIPMEIPSHFILAIGQEELLCETNNKFDTLTFQVLPDSCIGIKPALLSVRDSERLGLIRVQADEIHPFAY